MKKKVLLLLGIAMVLAVVPCQATPIALVQFSSFSAGDFLLTYVATPSLHNNLVVATTPIFFLAWTGTGYTGMFGYLTVTASSYTPGTLIGGNISQGGYSGTFSITSTPTGGTNYLSGHFGGSGRLSGTSSGGSTTFQDSVPPNGEVGFTSNFFDLTGAHSQALAFSLSAVTPGLSLNGGFLNTFSATVTGTFSVDYDVPEAGTSLLVGFGLLGLGFLRKRKSRA